MEISDTKKQIAEVALALFAVRGYESVGVNEIAEAANVTKPTLYYHFENKDGLLAYLVETHGGELLAVTAAAARYEHDIVMNMTALFEQTVAFAGGNIPFFRLMLRLFASGPQAPGYGVAHNLRVKLLEHYTELFRSATHDHGNMKGRETIYAETFWGLVETCAKLAINGTLKIEPSIRYRIIHQYMHGIFS
jgi:TetR/AcrR family transcriptional regulator